MWRGFQNGATTSSLRRMDQRQISLGSRAEQRLHGLVPTRSEADQNGSRSPQPKTTGHALASQRGLPRTLAQRMHRAEIHEAEGARAV